MKYIKLFEVHKEDLKKEVDIIYRDENLVCLVPKTQRASCVYGQGTRWCTKSKDGFESHKDSIMFRFIFKNKYKLRLTYNENGLSDWSDRSGNSYFEEMNIDKNKLFFISKDDINAYHHWRNKYDPTGSKTKLLVKYIKSIPKKCQSAIINYIDNKENYSNKYKSDIEHVPYRDRDLKKQFEDLDKRLKLEYGNLNHMSYGFDDNTQEFYVMEYDYDGKLNKLRFKDIKKYEDKLIELIKYAQI